MPETNLNAPQGQLGPLGGVAGGTTANKLNVIDPAHLEGDDLAAHNLMQSDPSVNPNADIF
ncbi:hypothetical protein ABTB44_20590, partial [Acinetobacter baumannii]